MTKTLGRGGRRRRMLNEEMVASSKTHAVPNSTGFSTNAPVYGEAGSSSNHARITDLTPRRSATIWLGWLLGLLVIGSLASLDYFRLQIAEFVSLEAIPAFDLYATGSLASWFSGTALLLAAVSCLIIFSIRRHRLDDYRGRYRVWLGASVVCLFLSLNAVTSLHLVFASAGTEISGWTALRGNAAWWLIGGALAFGWIGIRAFIDQWESRLARSASLLAISCFVFALVNYLELLPTGNALEPALAGLLIPVATLVGYLCLLISTIAYARFVILSADGLIASKAKTSVSTTKSSSSKATTSKTASKPATSSTSHKNRALNSAGSKKTAPETVQWVDGSSPEDDSYDEFEKPAKKRLSKSERKRLRKQKADQRRAA